MTITRRRLGSGFAASVLLATWSGRPAAEPRAATVERRLTEIERRSGGRLGVAILDTAAGTVTGHRLDERFPMCSTFKAVAAAAVLARVDRARDRLDRRIRYPASVLIPGSPATTPHAGTDGMTLAALCEAAVTLSDNAAANLLLDSIGGPQGLTAHLRTVGDPVTRLDRTEPTLNEALPGDPRDTTTPRAMAQTLRRLVLGEALRSASRAQLADWLIGCKTGGKRIRAGLPGGWTVGDKTGTGDRGTANDVAVIWPPGRAPLVVTVYLTQWPGSLDSRNDIIADVGRLVE